VITVNDYLAQRDAESMQKIYKFCGLHVAAVVQGMEPDERRQAYAADITYGTNKEVTADFLRDLLARGARCTAESVLVDSLAGRPHSTADRLVQRGLAYAIVDEADSVLIDESVTPLIISGPAPNSEQLDAFYRSAVLASDMNRGTDYGVNRRDRSIEWTRAGREHLANLCKTDAGIWQGARRREEMVTKALTAKELYQKDKHYVIDEGKVVIVDDFTGRLMPDRSWRDGLHQAVEAKEELEVTQPKDTYARISFQRFFRLYRRISGMTGTAMEAASEFWHLYNLRVIVIPPNKRCRRKQRRDIVVASESAKWHRIVTEIERLHEVDRPVLIGTRSVRTSEHLSFLLQEKKLSHQVLNAVRHREEATIVAEAGQPGRITVATNMAGRGTDIKLGRDVAKKGGLHVIAAERNESKRVDRQLFGRCARQGDPGSARAIVSLEDELVQRYGGVTPSVLSRMAGGFRMNLRSPVTQSLFYHAQHRAQKLARQRRHTVMKTDNWLDEHLGFAGGTS
ncbi:prepilin peptidase, partial [Planctomycetota bacterium]